MANGVWLIYIGKCLIGIGSPGLIHYRSVIINFTNAIVDPGLRRTAFRRLQVPAEPAPTWNY